MNRRFTNAEKTKIVEYLKGYVTIHKQRRIEEVLAQRTRYVTLVLEDIFKTHNASAVLRTTECLGIQDVHIIQNTNAYTTNPYVLRGSLKWLTINQYGDGQGDYTASCFEALKAKGYRIVATSVKPDAKSIMDFDFDEKIAVVLGTEHSGISQYTEDKADDLVTIPMHGFTDSFNVSVSAGIILGQILFKLKAKEIDWCLTAMEKDELRFDWYKQIPQHADEILKKFVNSEEFQTL